MCIRDSTNGATGRRGTSARTSEGGGASGASGIGLAPGAAAAASPELGSRLGERMRGGDAGAPPPWAPELTRCVRSASAWGGGNTKWESSS